MLTKNKFKLTFESTMKRIHVQESNGEQKKRDGLFEEVIAAIRRVGGYGSVEIYVQDHEVRQITARTIKKTKYTVTDQIGA